jgi:hypothetical protein
MMRMDRGTVLRRGVLVLSFALLGAYGCERPNPYKLTGDTNAHDNCPPGDTGNDNSSGQGGSSTSTGSGANGPDTTELDARVIDYGEALRAASLKIVGNLPDLQTIYELDDSAEPNKPDKYEEIVDRMLADSRFTERMLEYYRTVFKMYGPGLAQDDPSRETAPTFAARIMVEGRDWKELLTATTNTCPSYDPQMGFVDGDCNNNITPAGILTDPGVQGLFWGNLAFRRNRFFHEIFLCRAANAPGGAEPSDTPSDDGGCAGSTPPNYTSPWPLGSIAGACNGGRVDFHEYNTTTICANCHTTWNHRAPLFAKFDDKGMYDPNNFQVLVPVEGAPTAQLSDWLPPGEGFAWKFGMPVTDLTSLGQTMADDPEVTTCAVKRIWNYAMSRGDIVERQASVPDVVIADYVAFFEQNQFNLKATLREILLSEDFVSF